IESSLPCHGTQADELLLHPQQHSDCLPANSDRNSRKLSASRRQHHHTRCIAATDWRERANPKMNRILFLVAILCCAGCMSHSDFIPDDLEKTRPWTFDQGGVIRGDPSRKQIALIFTGGDFGEGTEHILDVLKSR